jgi:hypothetical protein
MAKGRSRRNREEKKPKASKKAAQTAATFLRPQTAGPQPAPKGSAKGA